MGFSHGILIDFNMIPFFLLRVLWDRGLTFPFLSGSFPGHGVLLISESKFGRLGLLNPGSRAENIENQNNLSFVLFDFWTPWE